MKINLCPNCNSKHITYYAPGWTMDWNICKDCGYCWKERF